MRRLTVAIDIMGGDYGPRSTIPAAIKAIDEISFLHLILCGDAQLLQTELNKYNKLHHPRIQIEHCSQVINMGERPVTALRTKKDSSMRKALELVKKGKAQACVSAGNTGALLAIARFVLKMLPGVERPALITSLPTNSKDPVYLLDLGANVTCTEELLFQFAVMGSVLVHEVEGIDNPRVSLLNVGSEEIKGSKEIKRAGTRLSQEEHLNYSGFVEGTDIFAGKADVVVCDAFVGNVALKTCEGIATLIMNKLKQELSSHIFGKILGLFLFPILKKLYKRVNPDHYNGASLIGLRGIVIKSHGNASKDAFFSAIKEAVREIERQVPRKIEHKLDQVLNQQN